MSSASIFDSSMDRNMQEDGLLSPSVTSPPPRPAINHSNNISPFASAMLNSPALSAMTMAHSPARESSTAAPLHPMSAIEELIYEARSSHSSLLASICSYVTESTETHLLSTTSSIKQYYEHVLEQQHLESTNRIRQLESQLEDMTSKYEHLQVEYAKLEDKLEKRTEKVTHYINDRHIQRSDVTNKCSLISYFRAWKSISKRHARAKRLEKFLDRTETENLLHHYFVHLQVNRLNEKAERKLSEVKFKHETLSNEMARGYETEIVQLKQHNDEAQQHIQVEIEKRKHLEADMRTLFLQSVSQMNMQALSLFRKVEGSIDMSSFRDIHPFNMANTEEKVSNDNYQQGQENGSATSNLSINVVHDLDAGSTSFVDSPSSLSPQPRSVISTSSTVPFFSPMPSSSMGFQQMTSNHTPSVSMQQIPTISDGQPGFFPPSRQQQQQQQQPQFHGNQIVNEQIGDKVHYDRLSDMYKTAIPLNPPPKNQSAMNMGSSSQSFSKPTQNQPRNQTPSNKANQPNHPRFINAGQPNSSSAPKPTMMSARRAAGVTAPHTGKK